MTLDSGATPLRSDRRWARILPEHHRSYPGAHHRQWLRVAERHDPDAAGYIWVAMGGKVQRVWAPHFEIEQRARARILIVDDDKSIRDTLRLGLGKAGYEIHQARDGDEAIELWRELGPDLVITDIHMPRKSGLLLIEDIHERSPGTPLIVMTDGGPAHQFNLMGLAEVLGAIRTIAKPFTLDAVVQLVGQELG
jgi:CheY-like chemotaxis protein